MRQKIKRKGANKLFCLPNYQQLLLNSIIFQGIAVFNKKKLVFLIILKQTAVMSLIIGCNSEHNDTFMML